jgi:hypothetical protein
MSIAGAISFTLIPSFPIPRRRLGQVGDGALAHPVEVVDISRHEPGRRVIVDDHTVTGAAHMPDLVFEAEEHPLGVSGDDPVEVCFSTIRDPDI